jgi:hypothetical protein
VRSLLGSLGGNWGQKFLYLAGNDILYTHLGCFGAPGEQKRALNRLTMCSRSLAFLIRQAVPVSFLSLSFAPGLIGLGSLYLKICISVVLIYLNILHSFLCLCGGRNGWMGMDGSGC